LQAVQAAVELQGIIPLTHTAWETQHQEQRILEVAVALLAVQTCLAAKVVLV
jgi:hypothetical protein